MLFQMNYNKWNGIKDKNVFENTSLDKKNFDYLEKIEILDCNKIKIIVTGDIENSGGYITINEIYKIPINSEATIDLKDTNIISLSLIVAANSKVTLKNIFIEKQTNRKLIDTIDRNKDVLVIVPDYPSYVNLYVCAFAHSRCREYVKAGLNVQVFAVNEAINFQLKYKRDNVDVVKGTYEDLKQTLRTKQYSTIIVHFVNKELYPIFEKYIQDNQKLIFICHGPETVYKYLVNKTRPYFTEEISASKIDEMFKEEDQYVKKFSKKDNVEWVFVSDWLKNFSEENQNLKFKHSRVINNIIDEDLFPYTKRDAELRKKILVVRKFDNISQHSIDQVVLCILELSKRNFFKDLEFDIYGDGNYYDELVEPLRQFDNVNLIRKFIPNEKLNEIYANHGIMMLPSRHDAHAVSMGESASTGLVVLGSTVTSNPYFMNQEENHTLTDPEDYIALADVVERIYNNPDEFLKISENMMKFTRQFIKQNTVQKEIDLIKESINDYNKDITFSINKEKPLLTIITLTKNDEDNIEACLLSILKAKNINKIEILVVDYNSKDNTKSIVKKYEKLSKGIIKLVNNHDLGKIMKSATGKYTRLMYGKDWLNSEELDKLTDIINTSDSDLILTSGSYDCLEKPNLEKFTNYANLVEKTKYRFEYLTYSGYGFKNYIELFERGNFKTKILKEFDFSNKTDFINLELNSFILPLVDTVTYYNLDLYRSYILNKNTNIDYKEQEKVIFKVLDSLDKLDSHKKEYILDKIILSLVDSQIIGYDKLVEYKSLDKFIKKLIKYSIYDECINYINEINGKSALILKVYKEKLENNDNTSVVKTGAYENILEYKNHKRYTSKSFNIKEKIRWVIKMVTPYGIVRLIQKIKK